MSSEANVRHTPLSLALRPKDAARSLGISQRTLWQLTKDGAIPCVRVRSCVLYPLPLLEAWLAEQAKGAPPCSAP
jgi:excisionase family DNA binding protein